MHTDQIVMIWLCKDFFPLDIDIAMIWVFSVEWKEVSMGAEKQDKKPTLYNKEG